MQPAATAIADICLEGNIDQFEQAFLDYIVVLDF